MFSLLFAQLFFVVLHKSGYLYNEITNVSIWKHNLMMKFIETAIKHCICATFVLRCTPLFALYASVSVTLFRLYAPVCTVRPCLRCTPLFVFPWFGLYAPVFVVRPRMRCPPLFALNSLSAFFSHCPF